MGGQAATLVQLRLNANEKQAQYQLNITSKYLERLGTKIPTSKCLTFQIKTRRDICYTVDPNLKIAENRISTVDPESIFKFFEAKIGPWKGLTSGILVPDIISCVKRVRKMNLTLKLATSAKLTALEILHKFKHI
jgi:hypothetical protein